jgi:hypothetical protein
MQDAFFKPSSGRATQVPRPKSELTSVAKNIGARLSQRTTKSGRNWVATKWLRQQLMNQEHTTQEKKSV